MSESSGWILCNSWQTDTGESSGFGPRGHTIHPLPFLLLGGAGYIGLALILSICLPPSAMFVELA